MKDRIKKFFSSRKNIVTIAIIVAIVLIVTIVIILIPKENKSKFALSGIYDVYPEEVRELYANMVSVSCYGDLYFENVSVDEGAVKITELDDKRVLDLIFSYLDKNDKLTDDMDVKAVEKAGDTLYYDEVDINDMIVDYQYGEYIYNINSGKVTREKSPCSSERQYVSELYGYSYNIDMLSMDVNIGYSQNGTLFTLDGNSLGGYDGNVEKLRNLFNRNSYYRYNFVLDKDEYKLVSVELNSKLF